MFSAMYSSRSSAASSPHSASTTRVPLLEGVRDVLEEDQAEHDVLVLGRIHRAPERVRHRPQLRLVTGRGAAVGLACLAIVSRCLHSPHRPGTDTRSRIAAQDTTWDVLPYTLLRRVANPGRFPAPQVLDPDFRGVSAAGNTGIYAGSPPSRRLGSPPVVEVEQIAEEEFVLLAWVGSWSIGKGGVRLTPFQETFQFAGIQHRNVKSPAPSRPRLSCRCAASANP